MEKDHLPDKPGPKHEKTRPNPSTQPTSQRQLGRHYLGIGDPGGQPTPCPRLSPPASMWQPYITPWRHLRGGFPEYSPRTDLGVLFKERKSSHPRGENTQDTREEPHFKFSSLAIVTIGSEWGRVRGVPELSALSKLVPRWISCYLEYRVSCSLRCWVLKAKLVCLLFACGFVIRSSNECSSRGLLIKAEVPSRR